MSDVQSLFDANTAWSARMLASNPDYFARLASQQTPKYLWIGCSDSRVPANQIVGLAPGEVFVHRNIANQVIHTDLNALSVLQFAVDVLKVEHVLVVGHYGCGGVKAAYEGRQMGLVDNWLRHVQDVRDRFRHHLGGLPEGERYDRLCELNVIQQVINVAQTSILRAAWARGQSVTLHGWCYGLNDGRIRDLQVSTSSYEEGVGLFRTATMAGPAGEAY